MQALTLIPFAFWLEPSSRRVEAGSGSRTTEPRMAAERDSDTSPQGRSAGAAGLSGADPDHPEPCGTASPHAVAPGSPPSLSELQQAMACHLKEQGHPGAEPLRWAITGTDPRRGLRIEGIGLHRTSAATGFAGDPATHTVASWPQEAGNASESEAH